MTFTVDGDFAAFFFCHCSRCRKSTGSAHGANLFSQSAHLTWLSGGDQVRQFKVPNTRFVKSFCAACGSALPSLSGGKLLVPAGSLDSEPHTAPTAHIFTGSKAGWDEDLDQVEKFAGGPGL